MRIALLVPGGVDRTGEHRVIPAVIALIERLSARHDVLVFALTQEPALEPELPICDPHHHFWDFRTSRIPY